jgi:hypothetical protein
MGSHPAEAVGRSCGHSVPMASTGKMWVGFKLGDPPVSLPADRSGHDHLGPNWKLPLGLFLSHSSDCFDCYLFVVGALTA